MRGSEGRIAWEAREGCAGSWAWWRKEGYAIGLRGWRDIFGALEGWFFVARSVQVGGADAFRFGGGAGSADLAVSVTLR